MVSPSSVIDKNNLGVAALAQGCYHHAMDLMRSATVSLNEMYQRNQVEEPNRREDGQLRVTCPIQTSPVAPVGEDVTVFLDQSASSMYRRAIVLSIHEDNLPVVASVVIFNLALCHHVVGTSLNISRRIASALKFYKMAYQIIEENRGQYAFADLLVLAVINNIAESSAQLYEVQRANKWFTFLSRILGVAGPNGNILPTLDEEDYVFFYVNAMVHQGQMLNAAPAA